MRAIFPSASGRSLFERYGARTYLVRVEIFAAEHAPEPEDDRLIELEGRLVVAKGPIPFVLRDLIAAGYFWALFERWLEEPASAVEDRPGRAGARSALARRAVRHLDGGGGSSPRVGSREERVGRPHARPG
jgi:hypothetical protein